MKLYVLVSSRHLKEAGIITYKCGLHIVTGASHQCTRRTVKEELSMLIILCSVICYHSVYCVILAKEGKEA